MNKMAKRALVLAMMIALVVLPTAAMAVIEVTPSNFSGITFNQNDTYEFTGSFTNELVINAEPGMEMTFDGSNATFKGHVKISFGKIADNKADLTKTRTGEYVIDGFKIDDSLSIGGCAVKSITVQNCEMKALDMNVSNCSVVVKNNTIESDGAYKRYDGGNNKYALYVYADNYDLDLLGNTISGKDGAICVQGNYEQFQKGNEAALKNSLNAENNVLTTKSGSVFKCYNDVTYAPVEWPEDYRITEDMEKLADQILAENDLTDVHEENLFNILVRANGKTDMEATEENYFEDVVEEYTERLHTPGEPVVENEVAATETAEGSYDLVTRCSGCGYEMERKTVTVPKLPAPDTSDLPKTGDNSNIALFAALLTMSAAGMLLLMRRRSAER